MIIKFRETEKHVVAFDVHGNNVSVMLSCMREVRFPYIKSAALVEDAIAIRKTRTMSDDVVDNVESRPLPPKSSTPSEPTRQKMLVDVRERDLYQALLSGSDAHCGDIESRRLDFADIQFVTVSGDGNVASIDIAFERKTVSDLCASIKDGRFREQKRRMTDNVMGRGKGRVAYILEALPGYAYLKQTAQRHGLQDTALQSTVYNIMFRDGLFVISTRDVNDTANCLRALWERHLKAVVVVGVESTSSSSNVTGEMAKLVLNSKRNKNITPDVCFLLQLCQIPGVSHKTAGMIAEQWKSMYAFYTSLGPLSKQERMQTLVRLPGLGKLSATSILNYMFTCGYESAS